MESVVVSQFLILLIASHLRFTSSLNRLHSKVCCNFWSFMASVLAQSHVLSSCGIDALPSSTTPIGWLSRMIQFKEKSRKLSVFVPVGADQKQQLELTHQLADRVNYLCDGRKWKKLGCRVSPSLVRFSAFAGSFEEIMSNPAYLDGVLAEGPKKAAVAGATVINFFGVYTHSNVLNECKSYSLKAHKLFDGVASTSSFQTVFIMSMVGFLSA
ncbi:hypothetical protein V6Z12_A05G048400 [Gossypium hirsutum]